MTKKFVDLSIYLENDVISDPPGAEPKIQYVKHSDSVDTVASFFPGLSGDQLPDGEGWAIELVQLSTHNGTHLDAPYHFHSTMDKGKPSLTIDEIPLEWCFQNGVKLDFRHFADGYVVTAEDIRQELDRIDYQLKPLDIVIVNTSAGKKYGHDDYVSSGCGVGYDATIYLLEQGVKVTGTDGWSWDAPFVHTKEKFLETGDASLIWEGHKAGRDMCYCHLEKLHNLEVLPSTGFTISCFPYFLRCLYSFWHISCF